MDPMESKTLDDFFGTPADRVAQVQTGVTAGNYDPREFYAYSNRATQHVADLWSRWTGVPNSHGAKSNQFKCVAKLLTEFPDVDLIEQAVNKLTRLGRISHGIDMYFMRTLATNECAKAKAHANRELILQEEFDSYEAADQVACPDCGVEIDESNVGQACKWHGGSYAEDVAIEERAES